MVCLSKIGEQLSFLKSEKYFEDLHGFKSIELPSVCLLSAKESTPFLP